MKTKKSKLLFVLMFAIPLMILVPLMTFAQGGDDKPTIELIKSYFGSIGLLAGLSVIVTAFFKSKKVNGFGLQFVSWIIGIVLALAGYLLHLGMFETLSLAWSLLAGFFAALAANGVADTVLIQAIYKVIKGNAG